MKLDSQPGIYAITDGSGRRYIGSSVRPRRRWIQHRCELRNGRHHSPALQAVVNKHGLESLTFEVLENVSADQLQAREQAFLDRERPELNCIYEAGPGRMHRDPTYRANLKAALKVANQRPEYRRRRQEGNSQKRAVVCVNDGLSFESCSAAARHYGITSGSVSSCATSVTHRTESGLRFEFSDGSSVKRASALQRRAIVNAETGQIFASVVAASKSIGVSRAAIKFAIANGTRSGGVQWADAPMAVNGRNFSTNEA